MSCEFQKFFWKQGKQVQFTIENENEDKCFNFLDVKLKKSNGRYEFDIYRKPALTGVQIKPESYIPSRSTTNIFKGFLARTSKIFSEKYLRTEIEYFTDMFSKNGYDQKTLQRIINNFEKKTRSIINNNNSNTNVTNNNNNNTNKKIITLPWIPKIGPKIKKNKFKSMDLE